MSICINRHYYFNENVVRQIFMNMGYDVEILIEADFTKNWWIEQVINMCLAKYQFIDCETYVARHNFIEDETNTDTEEAIFNLLASYTELYLHELKEEEVVSEVIVLDNTKLEVVVHDLITDNKTNYVLFGKGV